MITPGPWTIDNKYVIGPRSKEDDQSYGMVIGIADVYGPNRRADGFLMSYAPELLEQLKYAVSYAKKLEKALGHGEANQSLARAQALLKEVEEKTVS